jgi:hypothetical protein
VHTYVDPDASGAGDGTSWADAYTSLNAWEAAEQTDLVTDGDIHICHVRASSGTDDTTATIITGWTTGASNYIEVICNNDATYGYNRHTGQWDGSKYILDGSDAVAALSVEENYVRITGLQITNTYTATGGLRCVSLGSWLGVGSEIKLNYIICNGNGLDSNFGRGFDLAPGASAHIHNIYVYNSLIMNCPRGIQNSVDTDLDIYIYNCTVVHCNIGNGDGMHLTGDAPTVVKNCTVADCSDDFDDTGASVTIDYCASDDGTGTNAQTLSATRSDDFTDWSGGDYSIANASSVQEGNGTDDPGSGLYSDDIIENSRTSTWDIGAFEFVSPGGLSIPVAMHHYTKNLA